MDDTVARQQQVKMVCCCVVNRDSCTVHTSGPDEPICKFCVASGHPQDPSFAPTIKTTREVDIGGGVTVEVIE